VNKRHNHLRSVQETKKWTRNSVSLLRYTRTYNSHIIPFYKYILNTYKERIARSYIYTLFMVIKIEEFCLVLKKDFYLTQYNCLELNITQYKKNLEV